MMPTTQQQDGAGVADAAREKAQGAAEQVQSGVREQINQRSSQLAEQVNQQTEDLRAVSESLREQGKDGPAKAADRLAGYAEKVGSYLKDKDADALLSDAEDLGRRQPWAVAMGGLLAGMTASRFLKASSGERYRGSASSPSRPPLPSSSPPRGGVPTPPLAPAGGTQMPAPPAGASFGAAPIGS